MNFEIHRGTRHFSRLVFWKMEFEYFTKTCQNIRCSKAKKKVLSKRKQIKKRIVSCDFPLISRFSYYLGKTKNNVPYGKSVLKKHFCIILLRNKPKFIKKMYTYSYCKGLQERKKKVGKSQESLFFCSCRYHGNAQRKVEKNILENFSEIMKEFLQNRNQLFE